MSMRTAAPAAALVQVRRVLAAPADRVYRAWTEPELVQRVVAAVLGADLGCEVGVHLHSTRAGAVPRRW